MDIRSQLNGCPLLGYGQAQLKDRYRAQSRPAEVGRKRNVRLWANEYRSGRSSGRFRMSDNDALRTLPLNALLRGWAPSVRTFQM
jgi:hypothetical protein